jgi:hypothetical protein
MYNDEAHNTESSCCRVECEGKIIENDTLNECPSDDVNQMGIAKVPIVIGEFTVQIDVESKIKLPEPALEIKRIKKNVFLTQCRLIALANKVFLKGFIRKNIEYATIDCITSKAICGDIKHVTVHVPFQCTTEIKCLRSEVILSIPPSVEIKYFEEENLGINMKEQDSISSENFNEKIYCELEHSSIYEADIIEDAKLIAGHPIEHEFQCFIEKEVVYLTLKLLQNQQIGKACIENEGLCDC